MSLLRIVLFILLLLIVDCAVTSVSSKLVQIGTPAEIDFPNFEKSKGKIKFQKLVMADWAVDRSGLIDLDDPKSKEQGLKDVDEPIQIYLFVIDHPIHGRFFIDSGISQGFRKPEDLKINFLVKSAMKFEKFKIWETTSEWISKNPKPIKGIFLTHLHLDHIFGIGDFEKTIPIYIGQSESTAKAFQNLFVQGSTDSLIGKDRILQEIQFKKADQNLSAIDFFGDKSFLILHSPGHTDGSLAFLIHSETGTQLILGDTCHTKFGWENNVPPGSFTKDKLENKKSLQELQVLSKKIKNIFIHPGHQSL